MRLIRVVRIGKRYYRDQRINTHLSLVARAFGAESIFFEDAEKDILETIEKVNQNWGGNFKIVIGRGWKELVKQHRLSGWTIVHLTMYGLPLKQKIDELRKKDKIIVIIGGEKVPREVYFLADYNVSITSQPHSEIAALAIFLHELLQGKELEIEFENSKIRIVPMRKGKKVIKV